MQSQRLEVRRSGLVVPKVRKKSEWIDSEHYSELCYGSTNHQSHQSDTRSFITSLGNTSQSIQSGNAVQTRKGKHEQAQQKGGSRQWKTRQDGERRHDISMGKMTESSRTRHDVIRSCHHRKSKQGVSTLPSIRIHHVMAPHRVPHQQYHH